LKVEEVYFDRYWVECVSQSAACDAFRQTPRYRLTVTTNRDSCVVEMCQPGMTPDYEVLQGAALFFGGDYYADYAENYRIDVGNEMQPDLINVACVGSVISKMHLLRHTSASMPAGLQTSREQRQALLRLVAADYWGIGHPFTLERTKIGIRFENNPNISIPDNSPVASPSGTVEAQWNENGAVCLGSDLRLVPKKQVLEYCDNPQTNTDCLRLTHNPRPLLATSCPSDPDVPFHVTSSLPVVPGP
jgi:hypothetical protein